MSLDTILKEITAGLTGNSKDDLAYLKSQMEQYKDHELSQEILRACGIVSASGIKIKEDNDDDDYYDDEDGDDEVSGANTPRFRGSKVLYMTFTKRAAKNLHYLV